MATWLISLLAGRLPLKCLIFVVVLGSLPFTIYLLQYTRSKKFNYSAKPFPKDVWKDKERLGVITWTGNGSFDNHYGMLNHHIWLDLCETAVNVLRKWPHFPSFPDKRSFITEFHSTRGRDTTNNGERIYGFIHPQRSGDYKFAISSSGPSELWLSTNDDPAYSKLIAHVNSSTRKGEHSKYSGQTSREILLNAGKKYYIESLAVSGQGSEETRVAVYWLNCWSNNSIFEIISSKYLSCCYDDVNREAIIRPHAESKDNLQQSKDNLFHFNRLPLINRTEYIALIPTCSYSPSFLVRRKLKRYEGVTLTQESFVFPQDDTNMKNKEKPQGWSSPNPLINKSRAECIVNKFMTTLRRRNFHLKKVHKVIQKQDPENGDRFVLDLELGVLNGTNKTFRLTEHVYQKKGSNSLCLPEGMNWNSSATVYFIIPVKDQGNWVHHFIKQVTRASLLTGDTNFHVIIADFESKDINMSKAFNTSLLSSRHTIVQLTGKFYKTLALNEAAAAVPNAHDIVFLFDLHIDVPADIMDSVRKNTIAGRMAYFPVVGRMDCGSDSVEHYGFWQMNGYGLMAMYKSDWIKLGGMNIKDYKFKWGGEDWDLLDRVMMMTFEVERIRYPGLFHYFHSRQRQWN